MSSVKKKRRYGVLITIIILFVVGVGGYMYAMSTLNPVSASKEQKEVEIKPGTSTAGIGDLLEQNGLIRNSKSFQIYIKWNELHGLKAGTYLLSPSMSVKEIADQIVGGQVHVSHKITIREGAQMSDIASDIAKDFQMNKDEVVRQLNDPVLIDKLKVKYPQLITDKVKDPAITYKLEGYFYPATYSYYKQKMSIEDIVTPMLKKTDAYVQQHMAEIKQKQWDVHQFLTMSSLIEEEATASVDRQKIASVFYNRLKVNMPLQTDPTVLYALGKHKERVLYEDLKVNSPYNTYVVKGLPIGPIGTASEASFQAVLTPAQTDYIFFLAAPTGEVFFTKTLEEHNVLKAKYITKK